MPTSRKRRAAAARANRQQRHREPAAGTQLLDGPGTLASWLLPRLDAAAVIAIRTGWISGAGIERILPALVAVLDGGGQVTIVANAMNDLTNEAAYLLLAELAAQYPDQMAVTLVGLQVFQHGKVYYVRGRGGQEAAYVGSANLTANGLDRNHETGIVLHGGPVVRQLAASVATWRNHPARLNPADVERIRRGEHETPHSAAGGCDAIRAHPCVRCGAVPPGPCLDDQGAPAAEHRERITIALRARGRTDVFAWCGARTDGGRSLCANTAARDDVYCKPHRRRADQGLPI